MDLNPPYKRTAGEVTAVAGNTQTPRFPPLPIFQKALPDQDETFLMISWMIQNLNITCPVFGETSGEFQGG